MLQLLCVNGPYLVQNEYILDRTVTHRPPGFRQMPSMGIKLQIAEYVPILGSLTHVWTEPHSAEPEQ